MPVKLYLSYPNQVLKKYERQTKQRQYKHVVYAGGKAFNFEKQNYGTSEGQSAVVVTLAQPHVPVHPFVTVSFIYYIELVLSKYDFCGLTPPWLCQRLTVRA